jgi:ribosomal protein S18 acetylase RimI-like enzyme
MDDASLVVRPFHRGDDLDRVAELWRATLEPDWPVLPDGLAILRAGYVADRAGRMVGMIGTDSLGSVTFVAVTPEHQRQGIGRQLVDRAVADFRRAGLQAVAAGSGSHGRIWPGVPTDQANAVAFFDALDWRKDYVVTDLVQDLQAAGLPDRLAPFSPAVGVGIELADPLDPRQTAAVLEFEDTHFPQWSPTFRDSGDEVLTAHDPAGTILATLLLAGPGRASRYWPLLGDDCATIGCVGVSPDHEGKGLGSALVAAATRLLAARGAGMCHIDWVVRVDFYRRLGYRPWRTFSMRTLSL